MKGQHKTPGHKLLRERRVVQRRMPPVRSCLRSRGGLLVVPRGYLGGVSETSLAVFASEASIKI